MTRYRVNMQATAYYAIEVEAEDEDSAVDAAYAEAPDICAQCSGWGQKYSMELGEWGLADDDPEWGFCAVTKADGDNDE